MNWLKILELVGPAILSLFPQVPPAIIPYVVKGIATTEAMQGATGAQKKAAVLALVSTAPEGGTIDPATDAALAVGPAIDAIVQLTNQLHRGA